MAHIRSESASTATSYATARSDTGSDYMDKASDGGEQDYYGGTEEERTVKKLNQVIMVSSAILVEAVSLSNGRA